MKSFRIILCHYGCQHEKALHGWELSLKRLTSHMLFLLFYFLMSCWDSWQCTTSGLFYTNSPVNMKKLFRNRKWKAIYCLFPTLHCVQGMLGILKTTIRWSHSGLFYATMAVNMKKLSSGAVVEKAYLQVTCCCWCSSFYVHVEILAKCTTSGLFYANLPVNMKKLFSELTMKSHLLFVSHIALCKGHAWDIENSN